jgi:Protein of unknown function (DUF1579)
MKTRTVTCALLVAAGLAFWAGRSFSGDDDGASPAPNPMEEAMAALGRPGPQHEGLAKMAGTWDVKGQSFWQGTEPVAGVSNMTSLLGGRYLTERMTADAGGRPFQGFGIVGYDNGKKAWFSLWMDSTSTGYMAETGPDQADHHPKELKGTLDLPMGAVQTRTVLTFQGDDAYTMDAYWTMQGQEQRVVHLEYTRRAR